MTRIIAEIFNDLTSNLSYESLGLLSIMLMIIMCCMGKCGCKRDKNGKVQVSVGESENKKEKKETPGYWEKPRAKTIGAIQNNQNNEDDSMYKLSTSQKAVL